MATSRSSENLSVEDVAKIVDNLSDLNSGRTNDNDKINQDIRDEVGKFGATALSKINNLNKIDEES